MASSETVRKMFAAVWMKFPSRRLKSVDEVSLATSLWGAILKDVPDADVMQAVQRFMSEVAKLYPDDDPFAMIKSWACPKPEELMTSGDCQAIVMEAVSQFGYPREVEALAWIRSKSKLAYAAISRIGFREFCLSEEPDVTRGQLRMVFETEKKRADEIGWIVEDVAQIEAGEPKRLAGPEKAGDVAGKMLTLIGGKFRKDKAA